MEKMSLEERIEQTRRNFINDITKLSDIGHYDGYIDYKKNPEDGIRTIYELIEFMLKQDENFKRKYEPAVKHILTLTDRENQRYYGYKNCYNEDCKEYQYDSEKIQDSFSSYLSHEEWNSPAFSAREAVLRHLKRYGAYDSTPDRIMDYLLCLLRDAIEMFEDNEWAIKLSEIEQIKEKLVIEECEEKEEQEETKRCLAVKYMEIITALFNGEKITDDKYCSSNIISDMIDDCGPIAYETIKNLDDKVKVNGITLKQYVISTSIHDLYHSFGYKGNHTQELCASIYENQETSKYELLKSLIVGKVSNMPDDIFETIDEDTFKKITSEIEIDESNIYYLLRLSTKISIECVRTILSRVSVNNYSKLYDDILCLSKNYPQDGIMFIKLFDEIHVPEDKKEEHIEFRKKLLAKTFESTFYNSHMREEIDVEYLIEVFKSHKDLKELKEYIYNTILLDDRYNASSEYLSAIIYAYLITYREATSEEIDVQDFMAEFLKTVLEKRQIKEIQKSTRGIFNYTGSNMYEVVYEDDKVKLSYLDGINGLYVEKKGPKYNEERYYLYPAINEETETFIAKRTDVLPKDLLEELTSKENDTAFNFLSFRTDHYTKYLPNEEVSDKGWPEFTKESYINLTGDDSLSDEEAYEETCKIIESNPILKRLIKVGQKTYKKEANE